MLEKPLSGRDPTRKALLHGRGEGRGCKVELPRFAETFMHNYWGLTSQP